MILNARITKKTFCNETINVNKGLTRYLSMANKHIPMDVFICHGQIPGKSYQ